MSARIALPKPMMPCSKFLFLATIFPENVGERGGGGGGGEGVLKTLKKVKKKFSGHKQVKLRVKKICPYKLLLKHG